MTFQLHMLCRWTASYSLWEQFSTWSHTIESNLFSVWADSVKRKYHGEIQTQDQPKFSGIFKFSPIA